MPLFITQGYLVAIAAVVAFWFTHLPEWTTWLLLIAMALYDLVAVLVPGDGLTLAAGATELYIVMDRQRGWLWVPCKRAALL